MPQKKMAGPATGPATEDAKTQYSAVDDLNLYLDTVFGDTEGYLHIATGVGPYFNANGKYKHKLWIDNHYPWPAQRDKAVSALLSAAEDSDAYACPYLMVGDKRAKGAAVDRTKAHADCDGQIDLDKVRAINGFAVASGSGGHAQVFVALTESVPAIQQEALCRALGNYLGDADAKISDNDVLRPPGTWNHKARARGAQPTPVQWLIRPDGTKWEPHALAAELGTTLPDKTTPAAGTTRGAKTASATTEPVNLDTLPELKAVLDKNTGDRSADTMRVVGACHNHGLTLPQTRAVVNTRTDLAERLAERPAADDDVLECWLKVTDSRQNRVTEVGAADEFTPKPKTENPSKTAPNFELPRLWNATDLAAASQPRWLATGRLPRAAITLLIGDEGIGKSLLWVWLVYYITTGKACPQFGIPARAPGCVIIVVTEDDWTTTVRPRLEVAGANLDMIRAICVEKDGSGAPIFPRDLHLIRDADPTPDLVVVDAWLDTVPSGLSVRDPQQARQALHPWKEVATITEAAVLLLTHTNRVASANAREKYGATGELRKKARMTLFAQAGEEDGQLVVGPEKMNTAAPLPATVFAINSVQHFPPTDDHDGTVPRLVYAGQADQTAREYLADVFAADHNPQKGEEGVIWLQTFMAHGPRWATDIFNAGKTAQLSEKRIRAAKLKLNIEADRESPTGPWFWRTPGQTGAPDAPQMTPSQGIWASGTSGESGNPHIPPLSSQDSLMTNRETQGHLGTAPVRQKKGNLGRAGTRTPADPPCVYCRQPVASKTKNSDGNFAHLGCIPASPNDWSDLLDGIETTGEAPQHPQAVCRYCRTPIPAHMHSQVSRGYCNRPDCITAAKDGVA